MKKVTRRQMVGALRDWQKVLRDSNQYRRGRRWVLPSNIRDEINVLECAITLIRSVPNG